MDRKQNEKYIRMTTAPVKGLIVRLAIPTMISMLVTTLYNLVDTYFVGQLADTRATAAVTVSYALMNIIQAVGFFFGQGSGNYISRALGNKEAEKCRKMAATGFLGALLSGTLILVFGMIFAEPLALLCGSEKDAQSLGYATDYMRVILIGAPAMCSSLVLNNQLRFQGNATFAMVGLSSGAVINVLLDALLVPRYKVFGAAIATVACQYVSFFVLLFCTKFLSDNLKFSIKDASFRPFYLKEIFRGGFPSLCRQGIASVMNVSLMHCCAIAATAQQTTSVLQAAFGIVSKLTMFISSMMIGFGQGFQPVCGFNFGAKKYDRVKDGVKFCTKSSLLVLIAFSVIGIVFAPQLIAQFRDDPEVIAIGVRTLRFQCISFPLVGWIIISNMMAQTIGYTVRASIMGMGRQFLFFVPCLYIMSAVMGLTGIEASQMTADIIGFVVSLAIGIDILKKMK